MDNYAQYISINMEETKSANFSWRLTRREDEVINSANRVMQHLIDYKRNKMLNRRASLKGVKGIMRWTKNNPGKSIAYAFVVSVAILMGKRIK